MTSSMVEIKKPMAADLTISEYEMTVNLVDGRKITVPLDWFPRLAHAKPQERGNWRLISEGEGVNWPDLDEDISVEGLIAGRRSAESTSSFDRWLTRYSRGQSQRGQLNSPNEAQSPRHAKLDDRLRMSVGNWRALN